MKKFKGLFKKNLAVLLAVVLVAGILLPVLPTLVKAGASEAEDIAELKAAWIAMMEKEVTSTNKWPRFYVNTSGTVDTAFMAPADYVAAGGVIDGIKIDDLGTFVATQDIEAGSSFLFGGQNPTNGNADTMTEIHDYEDAYIYYKVNEVTTPGQFGLKYNAYSYLGGGTSTLASRERNSTSKISITEEDVAKGWQRIALGEFLNNDMHFSYDWRTETGFTSNERLLRLVLVSENGLEANITFGSLVGEKAPALPAGSDSWGINEWLAAADELDVSEYTNTEEFKALVDTLLAKYPSASIGILKTAWGKMLKKTPESTNKWPRFYGNTNGIVDTAYMDPATYVANGGSIDGITTSELGSLVATQNIGADGSFFFGGQNPTNYQGDTITYIHDYEDAYIYYKVNSVTTAGQFGLKYYVQSTLGGQVSNAKRERISKSKITITQEDVSKGWQKIKLDAFLNNDRDFAYDWKTDTGFTASEYLFRLGLFSENGLEANITFGSLVALKSAVVPSDSETASWDAEDWIIAADAIDTSEYLNTEKFASTLSKLKTLYPEVSLALLKAAWGNMVQTTAVSTNKIAKYYKDSNGLVENTTTTAEYVANGGSVEGIDVGSLGSYVATVDMASDGEVYLAGKSPDNPFGDTLTFVHEYAEAYVYYKVNSVTTAGQLGAQMYVNCDLTGTGAGNRAPSSVDKISVTEADVAKGWQKIPLQHFFNGNGINYDWKTQFTSDNYIYRLIFKAENGLEADISFGSLVGFKNAVVPSDSETASWTAEDWIIEADKVDTTQYFNTEKFVSILNELKAAYPETALRLLKNAWSAMLEKNAIPLNKYVKYFEDANGPTENTTTAADYVANGGSLQGIDNSKLGSHVGTYDIKAGEKVHLSGKEIDKFSNPFADTLTYVSDYSDAYVYYKVNSVTTSGQLGTQMYVHCDLTGTGVKNSAPSSVDKIAITQADVAKGWQRIPLQHFFNGNGINYDWKTQFTAEDYIYRMLFVAEGNLEANISFGSLVGIKNVSLPTNTDEWDIGDWIVAADRLDISNYTNTEKFTDTLNALKSQYSETLTLANLKYAWKELLASRSTVLRPTHYYTDSDIKNSIIKKTATAESGVSGISTALLGSVTTTYDMVGLDSTIPTNKYDSSVVLSNTNVWVDDPYSNTTERQVTIDTYDNLYVYFKVNSIKSEGKLAPVMMWQHKGRQTNSATYIDITAEDVGVWQKISIADMTSGTACADWKSIATGAHLQNVQLCAVEGLEANITFGSFVGERQSEFQNTEGYNLADWVYAALQINTNNYSDNATSVNNFNSALGAAKSLCDSLGITRSGEQVSYENAGDVEISTFGNNILKGIEPTVTYFDGSVASELDEYKLFDWNRLTDGALDLDSTAEKVTFATENSFFELVYDLKGKGSIDKILMAHTSNVALRNAKYKISLATDYEDLFSTETVLADYDNSVGDFAQSFTSGTGPAYQGRYLGVRIYVPATDMTSYDNIVRLSEIGAYGSISKYSSVVTSQISNDEVAKLGKNLLTNDGMVLYTKNRDSDPKGSWKYTKPSAIPGNLYNGNTNDTVELYDTPDTSCVYSADESISQWLMFDLRDTYDISKVLVCSTAEGGYWALGRYEIYASNNINELTKPASLVFSYDNRDTGPNQHAPGQLFTMEEGAMAARYVAIRITHPVSTFNPQFAPSVRNEKNMNYARMAEIGFYGEKYNKPLRRINLSAHVPTKIYRTDANGVHTEIGADEYKAAEQKLLYDGRYNVAVPIDRNGQTLDYVLNLSQNARLLEVKLSTLTANMRKVKIYAALTEEDVWKETALAGTYVGDATAEIIKQYADSPLLARYLRISVQDTVNDTFDVTEIEAIGWNTQEFDYVNLVGDRPELLSVYLEDKTTWDLKYYNESIEKYYPDYPILNALDEDAESIADIYAGKNGKQTINILFDLGVNDVVDNFSFTAASERDYWPEKLNLYLSENEEDIFGEDAKPVKSFTEKLDESTGGVYTFDLMPQMARFVRIEVDETHHPYYDDDDTILAVFDSIKVNGYTVVGVVDESGAIASFTDKATGIRVDIMANSENDLFNVVKRMEVTKITPSEENLETLKNAGMKFASDLYEITFYDSSDNVVTDIGGRTVKIFFPKSMYDGTDDVWIMNADLLGDFMIGDSQEFDGNWYITSTDDVSFMQFALGVFAAYESEDDNSTSNTGDETPTPDDEEEEEESEESEQESTKKRRKKIRVIKKVVGGIAWWIYVIIAVAVLAVIGGVLWYFLYFRKKRKEKKESENKELEG